MYHVNEEIKNCTRIFPDQGRAGYLRLDMNENPEGLPQEIVDQIKDEITPEFLATYPEPGVFMKKYANFIGVKEDNLCTTNGSDSAIRSVMQTFVGKGKEVVTVAPSFEMYMVNCWLLGLVHKPVPYEDDLTMDVNHIMEAIGEDTDMVVLLNPNNPLGNVYTEEEVRKVIEKARENEAVVVIDEAYHYFCESTFLDLINEYDNLLILRTFSKCFSLAGVRLGVIIGDSTIIKYVTNLRLSFEVNTVALKCAEIVLDTPGLIDRLKQTEREGRNYVLCALKENGYECFYGEGNFVFFKPKTGVETLKQRLFENKILVKTYSNKMLSDWIRINTGSKKVMEQFMEKLLKVDAKEKV
nr:histidinol-phosphate transaminase [uncultured Marvinbryantia sp.]